MWILVRYFLFLLPPESAHFLGGLVLKALSIFYRLSRSKADVPKLPNNRPVAMLGDFPVDFPLGIAAGFDKNAEYCLGLRYLGFGFVEVGTITPKPQAGNPPPRLFRVPEARALINRMGFNSEGIPAAKARLLELRKEKLDFPIGINLGKNKETPLDLAYRDYEIGIRELYSLSDYLVINISSPNTPGLTGLQEGDLFEPLVRKAVEARDEMAKRNGGPKRGLYLKLSPDLTNDSLVSAAGLALSRGFAGVIALNTSKNKGLPSISKSRYGREEGGLSGLPLRERSVFVLELLRKSLPKDSIIISAGGVFGSEDLLERLDKGANLCQTYTGFVYGGPNMVLKARKDWFGPNNLNK